MTKYNKFLLTYKNKCKKIHFDVERIKKIDKIYLKYFIKNSEKIVAYIKSNVPLFSLLMDGVIITDSAIYYHPANREEGYSNRIPFNDICAYLIVHKNKRASLDFYTKDVAMSIVGPTVFVTNTAAVEFAEMLREMQLKLLKGKEEAVYQYDNVVNWVIEDAEKCLDEDQLSDELILFLDSIIEYSNYKKRVLDVKAENLYRLFDHNAYTTFLSSNNIDERKDEIYANRFLEKLSCSEIIFKDKYMQKVLGNLSSVSTQDRNLILIKAYIAVRCYNQNCVDEVYESLNPDERDRLLMFQEKYYNQKMLCVYDMLSQGEPIEDDYLNLKDSLGLSALHYAIIFKDNNSIEELLQLHNWVEYIAPYKSEELANIYNFLIMAVLLNITQSKLESIYKFTSREAKSILDAQNSLEIKLQVQELKRQSKEKLIEYNKMKAAKARNEGDRDAFERAKERVEDLERDIQDIEYWISEYESEIKCLNDDLDILTQNAIFIAKQWKDKLLKSQSPVVQLLIKLYNDKEFLRHCIAANDLEWKMYEVEGFRFILPEDVPFLQNRENEKRNYKKSEQKEIHNDNKENKKLHGNSWFSEEAHRNLDILKKEYRKLVKEYHPDNCKKANCQEIIQQILIEKADIIKSLED